MFVSELWLGKMIHKFCEETLTQYQAFANYKQYRMIKIAGSLAPAFHAGCRQHGLLPEHISAALGGSGEPRFWKLVLSFRTPCYPNQYISVLISFMNIYITKCQSLGALVTLSPLWCFSCTLCDVAWMDYMTRGQCRVRDGQLVVCTLEKDAVCKSGGHRKA